LWLGRGGLENIDDIAYATGFSLEADPETVRHPEVFPGPYQCAFSHAVEIGGLQS